MEYDGTMQEWLDSLVSESTKRHHKLSLEKFQKFSGLTPEEILEKRKELGKRFGTLIVQYFKWLIDQQGVSENTASSYIIGIKSYLAYYDLPTKAKNLPTVHIKLNEFPLAPDDVQKLFRLNGLRTKCYIALSRDLPLRVNRIVSLKRDQIRESFRILAKKTKMVVPCFLSEETLELLKQMWAISPDSEYVLITNKGKPYSKRGLDKLLKRASKVAGIKPRNGQELHANCFRKLFWSIGIDNNVPKTILRLLMSKKIDPSESTYYIQQESKLRAAWKLIISKIPLEPKVPVNHKVSNLEEDILLLARALMKLIEQERGRPFGAMLGMLAKGEISEKEYLKQFLMEAWGTSTNAHQRITQRKPHAGKGEEMKMAKIREKKSKKEKEREPFPDEDREDSEAHGYESSAEMDLEDEDAEED